MTTSETLIGYLPNYYQESRQMRAIMDAVANTMPDVDQHLWKAFFIQFLSDASIDLWREEYGVQTDEELVARLSSAGMMNSETLMERGLTTFETFRAMPEQGLTLSESGVMADGREFMPLTTVIYSTADTWLLAKGLVKLMGLSGFRYLLSVCLQEKISIPAVVVHHSQTLHTGLVMNGRSGEELSGRSVIRFSAISSAVTSSHSVVHGLWWSPSYFFTDPLTFDQKVSNIQQSNIHIEKEEQDG